MTISFKANFLDQWYNLGYLSYRTITGRVLVMLCFLSPLLGCLFPLYNSPPNSPAHRFLLHHLLVIGLSSTVLFCFIYAFSIVIATFLTAAINPSWLGHSVTITEEVCVIINVVTTKTPWRRILRVAEEPDYFYFLGWRRSAFVPKRVFDSRAEAEAFFQLARGYWRQAKGIPPAPVPDTTGVWPPAPRPANSQEPDPSP